MQKGTSDREKASDLEFAIPEEATQRNTYLNK